MNLKEIHFKCKEIFYIWRGLDPMSVRLKRYRLNGAYIGEKVRAFSPITSSEPYLISIGNNVTISTGVKFVTHDNSAIKIFENGTDIIGSIEIGNNCFIGMNSIILPGVKLANNTIVGSGSVVTKSCLIEGKIIVGNPARVVSDVKDYKNKYEDFVFDFRNKNSVQKKSLIMDNKAKWLNK